MAKHIRSEPELLLAYDTATAENPLVVKAGESEILSNALRKRNRQLAALAKSTFIDREKVIGSGVKSMLDGKVYTNRTSYEQHLKDNGCVIVGNDYGDKIEPKKPEYNFKTRDALGKAVYQLADKYGIK